MKTTKKLLNDLVLRVCELTENVNNKKAAQEKGHEYYLWLNEGYDNYYSLAQIRVDGGTQYPPFKLSHHAFKAAEMATMLRGLIAGLTVACDYNKTKSIKFI